MHMEQTLQAGLPGPIKLLNSAFLFYRARFATVVGIAAIPFVLSATGALFRAYGVSGVSVFEAVSGVASLFATMALVRVLTLSKSDRTSVFGAYKEGIRFFVPFLYTQVLQGLAQLGAFTLLIIPGFFVSVWLSFTSFIVFSEGKRGFAVLLQSMAYTEGRWRELVWRMAALIAIFFIVFAIVAGVAGSGVFGKADGATVSTLLTHAFNNFVFFPLGLAYWYGVYIFIRSTRTIHDPAHTNIKMVRFLRVCMVIGVLGAITLFLAAVFGWLPRA